VEQSLLDGGDQEMLEDLLVAATNQALEKAKETAAQEMVKLTGNMNIPGLGEALEKLGMGGGGNPPAGS
jgi:DNA-binding protein YbaB